MNKDTQRGDINIWVILLGLAILLFAGALSFAIWAYSGRQDYKDNSDSKIKVAVSEAVKNTQITDSAKYAEAAKQPFNTYVGPEAYGSVQVAYPRTWSSYADTTNSSTPLDAYFQLGTVPGITDKAALFALRIKVVGQSYDSVLSSLTNVSSKDAPRVTPYRLPKVQNIIGSRLDGQIARNKQGSMIVLPLRDKTIEIWTESDQYLADFNNIILPNLSFSP
ncbi:MAG: hypothetical protein ABI220_00385 [Candidatus Saccharimonadales bacterium]